MTRTRAVGLVTDVLLIAIPVAIGIAIAITAVDVPFWDEWEWADLIYKAHTGTLTLADLWAQHNEHRIFFPQLLVVALDWLGGWSQAREQLVSLFVLACGQVALVTMVRRASRGIVGSIAAVFVTVVLYGLWQSENFTWGFQTAWFICTAAALGVAAIMSRSDRNAGQVLIAMAIAFVASLSSSQGLVVWVVGAVAILCTVRRWAGTLALWILAAGATYFIYKNGLAPVDSGHMSLRAHPIDAVTYVFAYLGTPIGMWKGLEASIVSGAVLVVLLAGFVVADLVRPNRLVHLLRRAPWYAVAAFPLACALPTAIGRGGFGVGQAMASRYTTISELAWIALIGIGATYAARSPVTSPAWALRVIAATGAMLFVFVIRSEMVGWSAWTAREDTFANARLGLIRADPAALRQLYPDPIRVQSLLEELRQIHDGVFSAP